MPRPHLKNIGRLDRRSGRFALAGGRNSANHSVGNSSGIPWDDCCVRYHFSGIAGVVYALQYNRTGQRQRLFGEDKKQLRDKND